MGECRLPCADEAARDRGLAAGPGDHAGACSVGRGCRSAHDLTTTKGYLMLALHIARRALLLAIAICRHRAAGRGADLSVAEHHLRRLVRGRRHCRRHRPAGGAEAQRAPQADGRGGKSRRRRRQSGGQGGERRGGRRLHHPRHHHGARGQRDRHQEQGLLDRRPARHRDRGVEPGCLRRPSEQSGQGSRRVHQERQAEELHLWQRRRRHRAPYRRRVFFPRGRQGAGRARALHRRRRRRCSPPSATMSTRSC